MSDLQCPATVLLIARALLGSADVGPRLADRRLAGLFMESSVAADPHAVAFVTRLAEQGDHPVEVLTSARDSTSLARAIDQLSDLYRGETIAVVAPDSTLRDLLAAAAAPTELVVVAIDSSGWRVTHGPGAPH
jgi:hypothetical protein